MTMMTTMAMAMMDAMPMIMMMMAMAMVVALVLLLVVVMGVVMGVMAAGTLLVVDAEEVERGVDGGGEGYDGAGRSDASGTAAGTSGPATPAGRRRRAWSGGSQTRPAIKSCETATCEGGGAGGGATGERTLKRTFMRTFGLLKYS